MTYCNHSRKKLYNFNSSKFCLVMHRIPSITIFYFQFSSFCSVIKRCELFSFIYLQKLISSLVNDPHLLIFLSIICECFLCTTCAKIMTRNLIILIFFFLASDKHRLCIYYIITNNSFLCFLFLFNFGFI